MHQLSKVTKNRALNETPSHSYGVSLAILDHAVLPATQHKWTHPARDRYSISLPQRDDWFGTVSCIKHFL